MEFTEVEYRSAKRAAGSVARVNKGYIDSDDILGAIYEWMVVNYGKVVEWREEGSHGYLNTALYRAGLRYARKERARLTGSEPSDHHYYSVGQVEDLLPDVWDYDGWAMTADSPIYIRTTGGNPAEANNRLAMLVDVKFAVGNLPTVEREILSRRFNDGESLESIAMTFEVTEDAMRKRIDRIIKRVIRDLGGEPPYYGAGRKAKSNAAAQAEVST